MNVEVLPPEIATFGRTGINEWTAVWSQPGIDPDANRKREIEGELRSLLCEHQAGAQLVYRFPALYQDTADLEIIDNDFSVVTAHGADPTSTEKAVQIWAHGQCALLAQRMHELSGWPVLRLGIDHFLVQRPDGALVDAYGVCSPEHDEDVSCFNAIADRYEAYDVDWKKDDCDSAGSMISEDDRADTDKFLETPWMLAVFPKQYRLAPPLSYIPLEDRPDDPCDENHE